MAEAKSLSDLRELTDPKAMRALAHPTRLALLEALADAGTLTATQASEAVGESPASCSFHLRQLAKYGFVEEAGGGTGRQRPWKLAHVGMRFPDVQDDPETAMAAVGLQSALRERHLARYARATAARGHLPKKWREVTGDSQGLLYVTPQELRELDDELTGVLLRYQDRIADPAKRPKGSEPVEVLVLSYLRGD
jgi:DNA-binding transcriptional ArsR family regulator